MKLDFLFWKCSNSLRREDLFSFSKINIQQKRKGRKRKYGFTELYQIKLQYIHKFSTRKYVTSFFTKKNNERKW